MSNVSFTVCISLLIFSPVDLLISEMLNSPTVTMLLSISPFIVVSICLMYWGGCIYMLCVCIYTHTWRSYIYTYIYMYTYTLQYFGHLIWSIDSLEKTMMLGKIEGEGEGDDDEMFGWHHQLNGHEFE